MCGFVLNFQFVIIWLNRFSTNMLIDIINSLINDKLAIQIEAGVFTEYLLQFQ